ncbi:Hypothetical predicted protein, partial [Podarcis lilfordi]
PDHHDSRLEDASGKSPIFPLCSLRLLGSKPHSDVQGPTTIVFESLAKPGSSYKPLTP